MASEPKRPVHNSAKPQKLEGSHPNTLFGGQFTVPIFWIAAAMIAILFLVSIAFLVTMTWPGNAFTISNQFFLYVFLLLFSLALFLSLFAGEKYNITIAGMTFVGSAAVLASLLWLFSHFSEKIVGRLAPEIATLQFRCDALDSKERSLLMLVTGDDKYIGRLEAQVNRADRKALIRVGNSQIPYFSKHHLLLMNRGDDKFSIPVDFGFAHAFDIVAVSSAVDQSLRGGQRSQLDDHIETGEPSKLLKLQMDMDRNSETPRITAIFDLNVASDYCRSQRERAEGADTLSRLGVQEQ